MGRLAFYRKADQKLWNSSINVPQLAPEVIEAFQDNDIDKLRLLQQSGAYLSGVDASGSSLLTGAIKKKNKELFEYLLTLDDVPLNTCNFEGDNPIMLSFTHSNENFSLKLVEKGCCIHIADYFRNRLLHYAVMYDWIAVSEALIKRQTYINCENFFNETPLYIACKRGLVDHIILLLTFGGDPFIPACDGWNCFDMIAFKDNVAIQDVFFGLCSDEKTLNLTTLVDVMRQNSPSFPNLLRYIDKVAYNLKSLQNFGLNISILKPEWFRLFVDKFGYVVEKAIAVLDIIHIYSCIPESNKLLDNYVENLYIIFNNDLLASQIVTKTNDREYMAILEVMNSFQKYSDRLETLTELVCFLLSYGVSLKEEEVVKVYTTFGYCELFKIMLHMDIEYKVLGSRHLLPLMIYDVNMTIDKYLAKPYNYNTKTLHHIFDYFALPKLKDHCWNLDNNEITERILNLPTVPSLMELARTSARAHIIEKYKIKNSVEFYTILNRLPLAENHKQIIAFERKLYPSPN